MVSGNPARELEEALRGMRWGLDGGPFCLVGLAGEPGPEDLAALEEPPAQLVREVDELFPPDRSPVP